VYIPVLVGVLFIIETLVAILGAEFNRLDPVTSTDPEYSWRTTGVSAQPTETKGRKVPVITLMRLALLVAVGLGIYTGTQYSNLNQAGVQNNVKTAK
jgi:hypothetical protein